MQGGHGRAQAVVGGARATLPQAMTVPESARFPGERGAREARQLCSGGEPAPLGRSSAPRGAPRSAAHRVEQWPTGAPSCRQSELPSPQAPGTCRPWRPGPRRPRPASQRGRERRRRAKRGPSASKSLPRPRAAAARHAGCSHRVERRSQSHRASRGAGPSDRSGVRGLPRDWSQLHFACRSVEFRPAGRLCRPGARRRRAISDVPGANLHPDSRVGARQYGRAGTRRRWQALRGDRQRERAAGAATGSRGGARRASSARRRRCLPAVSNSDASHACPVPRPPIPPSPLWSPLALQSDRIKKLLDPSPSATAGLKEKIQGMKHLIAVSWPTHTRGGTWRASAQYWGTGAVVLRASKRGWRAACRGGSTIPCRGRGSFNLLFGSHCSRAPRGPSPAKLAVASGAPWLSRLRAWRRHACARGGCFRFVVPWSNRLSPRLLSASSSATRR